jgi:2-polyprenyl-6-methoxyphenol hydroxylase-like FAD-dependent oxidoreductase
MDADVIVIGAGPTGLMLANELGLAGVRTVVVERLPEPAGHSKALNLQPRSAEILELRGLLGPLLDRALGRLPAGHFAGLPVPLDYTPWDTRHPYQVGIPQDRVEAYLEEHLGDHGTPVLRGHEVTSVEDDGDGVTVAATGGITLRGRYAVGCDGGRSAVRRLLGVPFPGRDGRVSAVVVDITLKGRDASVPGQWRLPQLTPRQGRVAMMLPLADGVFRFLFSGPEQQTHDRDAPVTEAEVSRALRAASGEETELGELRWASRFNDAARQAERYRTGRVLLAGDAAHIHSPAGGQGMNLGLQDAFNLGWKLAGEVHGWAPAGLLDGYHTERHPVAARVLAHTRAQAILMSHDEDAGPLRGVFADLMRLPDANRYLAGMVGGLDVRYDIPGDHPLLGARMPDLDLTTGDGGTRVSDLLHGGRGLLLEFGDEPRHAGTAASWPARVDHRTARATRDIGASAVLIRPDGHVCWAGGPGEAPTGALNQWFGEPRQG